MLKTLLKVAVLCGAAATLGGCGGSVGGVSTGSRIEQGPVGIGSSINELKGTPCACAEIDMHLIEIPMNIPRQAVA